ncbi:MAG: condensation domain-containing protein [Longimicrobiales bacterium]
MSTTGARSPRLPERTPANASRRKSPSPLSRSELRTRVETLSPDQRALLAGRVMGSTDSMHGRTDQLVAWVVPSPTSPGRSAGAGTEGHTEAPDAAELRAFLRERLPEYIVPSLFVFVNTIPRLPNGKVDARALPDPVRAARDDDFVPPRTEREAALARVWANVLRVDRVGVNDNFFELGGDSILSIQVVARAKRAGLQLTPDLVFEHQTLGALANAATAATFVDVPRADITIAPLSPIQAWFFEQPLPSPHHWHQVIRLLPDPDFDRDRFERALQAVVAHHDALRLRFRREPAGWTQRSVSDPITLQHIGAPDCTDEAFAELLECRMHEICAATDLARGPLVHAAVVQREGRDSECVLLAVHHLLIDAVSWSILLDDLRAVYQSLEDAVDGMPRPSQEDVPVLAHTTSFLSWCDALASVARSGRFDDDAAFWVALPRDFPSLPQDRAGRFVERSAMTVTTSLDEEPTSHLLHDVHGAYNTNVEDVLLAALARTLTDWARHPRVLVGVERHGREPLVDPADLSRTIGWFTSFFPLVLESGPAWDAGTTLRTIKDRLRAIPHRGASYGVLDHMRLQTARDFVRGLKPELIFNHAGRLDSPDPASARGSWQSPVPPLQSRAPENERAHRIEVNTFIASGSLIAHWTASSEQYDRGTVERLATRFIDELRALIAHALDPRTSGFTPGDFPDAGLSQDALDRFLRGLGA